MLTEYGWDPFFATAFEKFRASGFEPGRVTAEHRGRYRVMIDRGEVSAEVSGALEYRAAGRSDFPAVGDWVALGSDLIHAVLPRRSCFSRKVAGERTDEQIVASNVDVVFLVSGLDHDFNLRRIERYLTMAHESGAEPVVVLNKADLCAEADAKIEQARRVARGVPVITASAATANGTDTLREWIGAGRTSALLGSSGVGKSSLINRLIGGVVQETAAVHESDSHGRHTTTSRQLLLLPGGGLVLDVPGMRELQMWSAPGGLSATFEDIESLAAQCRFRDCQHRGEQGCAVDAAVAEGALDAGRLENYRKLQRDIARLEVRKDARAMHEEKRKLRRLFREYNRVKSRW